MGLVYQNPNHAQDAQWQDAEGKPVVGFSARMDGVTPPLYSSWLIGTSAEYQDNHIAIFQAFASFLQEQGKVERRMVASIIAARPEEPEEELPEV